MGKKSKKKAKKRARRAEKREARAASHPPSHKELLLRRIRNERVQRHQQWLDRR
ncbi:MAG: hypothetical protein AAF267_16290 [Deinococcota bacterium]